VRYYRNKFVWTQTIVRRLWNTEAAPAGASLCFWNVIVRILAVVDLFDGTKYQLRVGHLADSADAPKGESGALEKGWTIDITRAGGNDRWRNALLPTCSVCLDREADVGLDREADVAFCCRCTVPCVCHKCAAQVSRCPQCRRKVGGNRWKLRPHPNIFSIEPSNDEPFCQVFLSTLMQTTPTLRVRLTWTVRALAALYQHKSGIPPQQQILISRGRPLCDSRTLRDYGIERETTFSHTLRLGGD